MGSLFSRGTQPSARDRLESIDRDLAFLTEERLAWDKWGRRAIGWVFLVAVLGYVAGAVYVYLNYVQSGAPTALLAAPLLGLAGCVWALRTIIQFFVSKALSNRDQKAIELRAERAEVLDNVKATETYKVAKEILDRYETPPLATISVSPQILRKRNGSDRDRSRSTSRERLRDGSLRRRNVSDRMRDDGLEERSAMDRTPQPVVGVRAVGARLAPLPPRDRSPMDKIVDYLLGDGPGSRYALICRQCHAHNGLALRDDAERLAFRCAYCGMFNPARLKPQMPTRASEGDCKETPNEVAADSSVTHVDAESKVDNFDKDPVTDVHDVPDPSPIES